jgi:hypothetical protein
MPLEREMLPDRPEAREKFLCAFRVAKATHAPLAFACRLVAVLCAVVQPGKGDCSVNGTLAEGHDGSGPVSCQHGKWLSAAKATPAQQVHYEVTLSEDGKTTESMSIVTDDGKLAPMSSTESQTYLSCTSVTDCTTHEVTTGLVISLAPSSVSDFLARFRLKHGII